MDIPVVEGAIGNSLPFLFLRDGDLSIFSLAWARAQSIERGWSPSALHKAVCAVGLFYDFYVIERQEKPLHPDELFQLVKQFYEARHFGLRSLGWPPVRLKTAGDDARFVSEFTEWCSKNLGLLPVNPIERESLSALNLGDQRRAFERFRRRKGWDKLFHLASATDEGKGVVEESRFRPKGRRPRAPAGKKHFPPDKVMSLIRATPSVRDKLYLLLLFFGGLRASEPLHLFVTDIRIKSNGMAEVVLGHPETGFYEWVDNVRGKQRGNRALFLAERYYLGPRNRLAFRHPLYSGWKGMAMDNGRRNESVVNWLFEEAGRIFARLHVQYMHETRSKVRDVVRNKHIYDASLQNQNTLIVYLRRNLRTARQQNDTLSTIRRFFDWLHDRLVAEGAPHADSFKNPVFKSDSTGKSSIPSQTNRDALPPYVMQEMKELLVENDFAFA
ncbi:hypothetical protein, partial [Ralstonia pseudosolanacearum]